MMVIADIYCRVSRDEQEKKYSLGEQRDAALKYCAENNLTVGEVWLETHTGSEYRERAKLEKMRKRYRDGKIQGVVFYVYDRLARSQSHQCILLEEMEHYGVQIHCTNERLEDTLESVLQPPLFRGDQRGRVLHQPCIGGSTQLMIK